MSAHAAQRIEGLTPREKEVFEDLVVGHSNRVIADKLGISPKTVEVHRPRVMKKMQAQSLPHLVRMALEIGKWAEKNKKMAIQAAQRIEGLTPREKEVFEDLVVGHSNRVIADKLGISPRTVEVHRARVMTKMQAQSLPHLVRMAFAIEAKEKA
jgi:two-component system response regulator FixJ